MFCCYCATYYWECSRIHPSSAISSSILQILHFDRLFSLLIRQNPHSLFGQLATDCAVFSFEFIYLNLSKMSNLSIFAHMCWNTSNLNFQDHTYGGTCRLVNSLSRVVIGFFQSEKPLVTDRCYQRLMAFQIENIPIITWDNNFIKSGHLRGRNHCFWSDRMVCEDLLRVMTEKIYLGISTSHYPPFSVVSQMHDRPIGMVLRGRSKSFQLSSLLCF
jgi:hypothetical protein